MNAPVDDDHEDDHEDMSWSTRTRRHDALDLLAARQTAAEEEEEEEEEEERRALRRLSRGSQSGPGHAGPDYAAPECDCGGARVWGGIGFDWALAVCVACGDDEEIDLEASDDEASS